jgi:hypothetical protein
MKVPISFRMLHAMADKHILVDSRATDNFIHPKLLKQLGLGAQTLDRPRKIWNIDGTMNRAGELMHFMDLKVRTGDKEEKMHFLITDLGNEDLILGYPWLVMFKPQFIWQSSDHRHHTPPNYHTLPRLAKGVFPTYSHMNGSWTANSLQTPATNQRRETRNPTGTRRRLCSLEGYFHRSSCRCQAIHPTSRAARLSLP